MTADDWFNSLLDMLSKAQHDASVLAKASAIVHFISLLGQPQSSDVLVPEEHGRFVRCMKLKMNPYQDYLQRHEISNPNGRDRLN